MKLIPLTQGKFAQVDDADYDFLMQWKWHADKSPSGNTFYAKRNDKSSGKNKAICMHRLLLGLTAPKIFGEHRDQNGLNNQRDNLREATHSENMRNTKSKKGSSSKYKGVSWVAKRNKWQSNIWLDRKQYPLGHFKLESEAALAYNKKAIELFGEFANLNIIE
jgi:hypothetical protein